MSLTPFDLSVRFFLQLAFILGVCRWTGWVYGLRTTREPDSLAA